MECPKFNLLKENIILVDKKQCIVTINDSYPYKYNCESFSSFNKCLEEHCKNTQFDGI
jgi:hypothetical protein